jgi:hypothetical protein
MRSHLTALAALAALAVLTYLPPLATQPLIQDDYPNIEMARVYAQPGGWGLMFADPVFRYRATFWVVTDWIDRAAGAAPLAFYLASVGLHVAAVWLVYALGAWPIIGWRIAGAAAAFFAVAESHQEAVMWYSASAESLMFVFGVGSLLCWIRFLGRPRAWGWYAPALVSFALALASKESAVILAALLLLPLGSVPNGRARRAFWLPFAALAAGDVWLIFRARAASFRFQDGSFSLHAPVWITWPVSYMRLLWPWALLALAAIWLLRDRRWRGLVATAALWMGIALIPYSFLTYMHRVPSRQVYLASLGAAWIAAAGFEAVRRRRRSVAAAVAVAAIAINIGYIWTKKRAQFRERAAPTEAVVALARKTPGSIYMRCYPDARIVAEAAVRMRAGKSAQILLWPPAARSENAADFCWTRR